MLPFFQKVMRTARFFSPSLDFSHLPLVFRRVFQPISGFILSYKLRADCLPFLHQGQICRVKRKISNIYR